jgi:hypothetical protein
MEDQIEEIRLLARFKLQVRRVLNQSVDLERLRSDPAYARTLLTQIEDRADDEELLVLAMRLHDILLPRLGGAVAPPPTAQVPEQKYMFGARS